MILIATHKNSVGDWSVALNKILLLKRVDGAVREFEHDVNIEQLETNVLNW